MNVFNVRLIHWFQLQVDAFRSGVGLHSSRIDRLITLFYDNCEPARFGSIVQKGSNAGIFKLFHCLSRLTTIGCGLTLKKPVNRDLFTPERMCMLIHPDQPLHCLLIQPKFAESNYWNFVEAARAVGAKATAPPLGLLTVAAILPQHWTYKLVDLNVRELTEQEWEQADLVCTGGMLPQQAGTLDVIRQAKQRGKYTVVGGPDPTSQPQMYEIADALVLGEGELSIPLWMKSWKEGQPLGTFATKDSPDITTTPIPRFDLIRFDDYLYVGLQSSRGCPYNCEFCDVIELFGRKPRVKEPEQFVKELKRLHELGYRGWIDIADDNFIGNRLKIKPVLNAVASWLQDNKYPFSFRPKPASILPMTTNSWT